jgi:hypothetical protein
MSVFINTARISCQLCSPFVSVERGPGVACDSKRSVGGGWVVTTNGRSGLKPASFINVFGGGVGEDRHDQTIPCRRRTQRRGRG